MRILVLIFVFGAMGLSPFLLSGKAEARRDLGVPPERCIEVVQDQIEELLASGPISHLPPGLLKMGLECIPEEGWVWAHPLVPSLEIPVGVPVQVQEQHQDDKTDLD